MSVLQGELSYPVDFTSSTSAGSGLGLSDYSSFTRFGQGAGGWDMDATPTLRSDGYEKGFPTLESEFVQIPEE